MKKILSFLLAALMLVSALPVAYATNPAADGTVVSYTSANEEAWTITVPAALAPNQGGKVTLAGKWPSNKTIIVTADESVILTSSINAADTKELEIDFDGGISADGDNEVEQTIEKAISVAAMPADAIFGVWSGTFYYNVSSTSSTTSGGDSSGDSTDDGTATIAMYSYNGVELPELPEWDKTVYPYAYLGQNLHQKISSKYEEYEYFLIVADALPYYSEDVPVQWLAYNAPWNLSIYGVSTDGEWVHLTNETSDNNRWWCKPTFWANTDVYDDVGNVVMPASDPVPVS